MMSFCVVPLSLSRLDPVLLGDGDVEAEQPRGGRVDRHRGVHLVERDAVEELVHVALVGDRDADLAHLAPGKDVIGVVAGLGRQVEGDREARLALFEVAPVELVRAPGVGVAGVGAHHPGAVALWKSVFAHHRNDIPAGGKSRFRHLNAHLFRRAVFSLTPMSKRITGVLALATVALVAFAASAARGFDHARPQPDGDRGQRAEVVKLFGSRCQAGGSNTAFRITIGKGTSECAYRTPVVGRDLQISATMRLLSKTPANIRTKAYLALSLRSGGGGHYQLAVFPLQRKAQLLKISPDGTEKVLRVAKNLKSVKGVDMANAMRLRAFNFTSGPEKGACKVIAFVGNDGNRRVHRSRRGRTRWTGVGLRGRLGQERPRGPSAAPTTSSSALPVPSE